MTIPLEPDRPSKETCLELAEWNFILDDDHRMWQWLLEWATWDEDLKCTITKEYQDFDVFMQKVMGGIE